MDNWRRYKHRGRRELGSAAPMPAVAPLVQRFVVMPEVVGEPADFLSGVTLVMDPVDVVVTSGKVETWNGPATITQADAAKRAAFNASDSDFNNQPSATFDGVDDVYPLGDLSALTQGEIFVVLKLANDPPSADTKTGFMKTTGNGIATTHYRWTDGVVYDSFGTSVRKTVGSITPNLALPHVYNSRSQAGEWTLEINGVQEFTTATNTVNFGNASFTSFGRDGATYFLDGKVAYVALCNQVQTATQRARMLRYLNERFAINSPTYVVMSPGSSNAGGKIYLP